MNSIIRALKPWIVVIVMIMVGWLVRMNSKSPTESQLLAEIPVDLVNTISAQKGGRTLLFERKGDAWMQTQPYSQPADPAAIHALLVAMAEARVIQASPLEKIPSRAGLNESAPSVKVVWPTGSATLCVGASHPAGLAWIANMDTKLGGPGSIELHRLLVEGDPVQLRGAKLFDRSGAASDRVIVQANSGTKRLEVALEKKEGRWYLIEPIEARADNNAVADFLEAVARLEHDGIVDDAPKDLALFGLAQPAAVITIRSLDISKGAITDEVLEIGGDGPAGPGVRFGKRRDRPGVFQLEKRSLSTLFPPSAAFIDSTILGVDPAEITSIALQNPNATLRANLARNVTAWNISIVDQPPRAADMKPVRELLQALCTARACDMATQSIPENLIVAKLAVALSNGSTISLTLGKDSTGRWLANDGGNLTRVYPDTVAFPIEPALFDSSNR